MFSASSQAVSICVDFNQPGLRTGVASRALVLHRSIKASGGSDGPLPLWSRRAALRLGGSGSKKQETEASSLSPCTTRVMTKQVLVIFLLEAAVP